LTIEKTIVRNNTNNIGIVDAVSAANSLKEDNEKRQVIIAIIPAYNESETIGKVVAETSKYVSSVIVIDDGSTDNTAEVASSMNATVVRNRHNAGKGAALKRGFIECLKCGPDVVITLDADGQHDPGEIPKLLQPILDEEADVVIGSRYRRTSLSVQMIPRYRRIGLSFIDFMNRNLANSRVEDSQSGFRLYSKSVLSLMSQYSSKGFGAEMEQLATAELYGLRIVEVPISIRYEGLKNTSKQNPFSHGIHIMSTILDIAVEKRPLLFFGLSGLVLMTAAIITTAIAARYYIHSHYFSVPLTLMTLGFVLLGFMLILVSLVLYELKRIPERWNARY
jgi:glycosyltransferase involved in cell wall biosynthesis